MICYFEGIIKFSPLYALIHDSDYTGHKFFLLYFNNVRQQDFTDFVIVSSESSKN